MKLSKIIQYPDGITDKAGFPYYYIYTDIVFDEDAEYFFEKGWSIVEEPQTFIEWIKSLFKIK